ncbi:MAG: pyridoxamine 5'-phosphate oxidase-related FMN-binding protein [bacterium]|nr:MAG: pyridoxamine 5'-phosphate oxidase-related FMN-binding protein [bacterium]
MAKDYATLPYNQVRRQDREVTDEAWIYEKLHKTPFGSFSTIYNGQPFINTNIFAYDEEKHVIYLHTAHQGRTRANAELNQRVCFSISEMGRFLPAKTAKAMSVEYSGVVIFGTVTIVKEELEARHALDLLLKKYFPHLTVEKDYQEITSQELEQTTVYRINIQEWSGKKKQEAADFPGAFFYPKY